MWFAGSQVPPASTIAAMFVAVTEMTKPSLRVKKTNILSFVWPSCNNVALVRMAGRRNERARVVGMKTPVFFPSVSPSMCLLYRMTAIGEVCAVVKKKNHCDNPQSIVGDCLFLFSPLLFLLLCDIAGDAESVAVV